VTTFCRWDRAHSNCTDACLPLWFAERTYYCLP